MSNDAILTDEFATLRLGDRRLDQRARRTLGALLADPASSFPFALTEAELEGHYRFVNNERVTFEALVAAHVDATKKRIAGLRRIVAPHDTTDCRFNDEVRREGLGPMDNGGQGFYFHAALAVTCDRAVLGVIATETWVRAEKDPKAPKPSQRERYLAPDKESLRWGRTVETAESALADTGALLIHVMDREADDYDLLDELLTRGRHFVIRSATDRRLAAPMGAPAKLKAFVRELDVACEREAQLSNRPKKGPSKDRKKFPARKKRTAVLTFCAERIRIQRPDKANKHLSPYLDLNVVYVNEPNAPDGCQPVEWILLTSEAIETDEQILQVVDDYRARWVIEEYFKALKTGCAFEARQHETKAALLNALGILIPIACSLLNLRTMARDPEQGTKPATDVLTPTQLEILHAKSKRALPKQPTVRDAVLAIARYFGGHLRGNGEPGWQVLGRGYQALLEAEDIWNLARSTM